MAHVRAITRAIRDRKTGHYFRGEGEWSEGIEGALNFDSIPNAVRACRNHMLEDVELVIHFGNQRTDVVVPIFGA